MVIDNVQRFEALKRDADELQELAYTDTSIDDLNMLLGVIDDTPLIGLPIKVSSGLQETKALNNELDDLTVFVPLGDNTVQGEYRGIVWRSEGLTMPDGSSNYFFRVCHMIASHAVSYYDGDGDLVAKTPMTYVTAADSAVEIFSTVGSHDYRKLYNDQLSTYIDQIAMDESIDLTEKANRIARLFRIMNATDMSAEKQHLYRQRLSYLNELGLFSDTVVVSPIGIMRNADEVLLTTTHEGNFVEQVEYVSVDGAVTMEGWEENNTSTISFEINVEPHGQISIPHILGKTKLIDTR